MTYVIFAVIIQPTTTDSSHKLPVADNHLNRQFTATAPNQVWVADKPTFAPMKAGCTLQATVTSSMVKWSVMLGERMTKNLVSQSLYRAVAARRPAKGLLHHSDRGSQYCAAEYRKLLDQFGMKASMSRRGNCYDNAPMESFWGTLKNELVHHRQYATRQEAIREITEYNILQPATKTSQAWAFQCKNVLINMRSVLELYK